MNKEAECIKMEKHCCGERSFDTNCPVCGNTGRVVAIKKNPDLEVDFLGNPKEWLCLKECNTCFCKYWHHICESLKRL